MNLLNFFTEDWKKIPPSYKYLIMMGIILIFNTWLLDHWGINKVYTFWGIEIRAVSYSLGLSLILIVFALLFFKQIDYYRRLFLYRRKYSADKLDKDYYLVWFRGKLILFDNKDKRYYHVYPWETAEDLFFVGRGTQSDLQFVPGSKDEIMLNESGQTLKIN